MGGSVCSASDLSWGHHHSGYELEPRVPLCADSSEPGACFSSCVSLSLCPSPAHTLSLSKLNEITKSLWIVHKANFREFQEWPNKDQSKKKQNRQSHLKEQWNLNLDFSRRPGWLRRLSLLSRLRSWSPGLWVRAPRRAPCWHLRAWSLLQILCLPLALPLPPTYSHSLSPCSQK